MDMSRLRNFYLFFYNLFQALGWAVSLLRVLSNFISNKSVNGAYTSAAELICLLQSLAFLEVIHGTLGIVPSGLLHPSIQWGGSIHFLLAIVRPIREVREFPSVFVTFVVWSLSDVIRYSHYALNCVGSSPYWITFIRYSAFIVLYRIGALPVLLMYRALPFIKRGNLYANSLPLSYCNYIKAFLVCFPFLWMKLYLHLFKQRGSKLGKQQKRKPH